MSEESRVPSCKYCVRFGTGGCNSISYVSKMFGTSGINTIWNCEVIIIIRRIYVTLAMSCSNYKFNPKSKFLK